MSTTRAGFTKLEPSEFKGWLKNQPKTGFNGIQIHHTWSPSYSNFYKSNGGHEDELTRQINIKDFHVNINNWGDIAQHFTIFPNGIIVTGRSLRKTTAIGIKGWNTGKICIEIYGNFDKGYDIMTKEQRDAVILVYGELCKHCSIIPSINTLRPHCWFTAGGTYLGDYNKSRSAKSCPGTNFMGFGNTKLAIKDHFIPLIEDYISGKPSKQLYLKVIADSVNIHSTPDFNSSSVCGKVEKGIALTIVKKIEREGTDMYLVKAGYYITASSKYVEVFER